MYELINQLPGPIWVTWMPLYTLYPLYPGCPFIPRMPLYTPVKNRCNDIQTHVVGYSNTCVWKSINKNKAVLEQMFITFHDKLLFAVSVCVYIAVHEI